MKRTRAPDAEAPSDSTVVAEPASLQCVLSAPANRAAFQETIFGKVLGQLDLPGLAQKVAEDAATRLAAQVRVETLVEAVVREEEQNLSTKLVERLLDRLALSL